jgi:hypothetical protein
MQSLTSTEERSNKGVVIAICIVALIGIITFALVAASYANFNKRFDDLNYKMAGLTDILKPTTAPITTTPATTITNTTPKSTTTMSETTTSTTPGTIAR